MKAKSSNCQSSLQPSIKEHDYQNIKLHFQAMVYISGQETTIVDQMSSNHTNHTCSTWETKQ
jgi:hypothetical protein